MVRLETHGARENFGSLRTVFGIQNMIMKAVPWLGLTTPLPTSIREYSLHASGVYLWGNKNKDIIEVWLEARGAR